MPPLLVSYIPLKDPSSPKRNELAFIHYIITMQQQFQDQHPSIPYDKLPKFTFSMYNDLPPVQKKIWETRATADETRYLMELATYVPPPGYDSKGLAIPTWPKFSFNFFTSEIRQKLQEDRPDLPYADISQLLLKRWWNLPSNEKQKYTDMELCDMHRFNGEMQQYQLQHTSELTPDAIQSNNYKVFTDTSNQHNQHSLCTTTTNSIITTSITPNKNVKNNNSTTSSTRTSNNTMKKDLVSSSSATTTTQQELLMASNISFSKELLHQTSANKSSASKKVLVAAGSIWPSGNSTSAIQHETASTASVGVLSNTTNPNRMNSNTMPASEASSLPWRPQCSSTPMSFSLSGYASAMTASATKPSEPSGTIGGWDQSNANEKLFTVKANFDENHYITALDKSAIPPHFHNRAERLAQDVEEQSSDNIHIREERSIVSCAADFDDDDKYSGVLCRTTTLPQDKPEPPQRQESDKKNGPEL
jgi:hypothetical protein